MQTNKISAQAAWPALLCLAILSTGCVARRPPPAAARQPAQTRLPAVKEAEKVKVAVMVPSLTPAEGEQRQEKGNVVLVLEPITYTAKRFVTDTEKKLVQRGHKEAGKVCDVYSVKTEPYYVTEPDKLRFKVRVINNHNRILRLKGAVVSFLVGGKSISIPSSSYEKFLAGMLTPRAEMEFTLTGLPLDDLPQDETLVGVQIFDIDTEINEAGTVTKKDNFEWYFTCKREEKSVSDEVSYREEKVEWPTGTCEQCGGRGQVGVCPKCKGTGDWTFFGAVDRGGCPTCKGTGRGTLPATCGECKGSGTVFVPPN